MWRIRLENRWFGAVGRAVSVFPAAFTVFIMPLLLLFISTVNINIIVIIIIIIIFYYWKTPNGQKLLLLFCTACTSLIINEEIG